MSRKKIEAALKAKGIVAKEISYYRQCPRPKGWDIIFDDKTINHFQLGNRVEPSGAVEFESTEAVIKWANSIQFVCWQSEEIKKVLKNKNLVSNKIELGPSESISMRFTSGVCKHLGIESNTVHVDDFLSLLDWISKIEPLKTKVDYRDIEALGIDNEAGEIHSIECPNCKEPVQFGASQWWSSNCSCGDWSLEMSAKLTVSEWG